jgi:RecA/RadA recombinase
MGELIHMKAGKINIKEMKKKINKSMGLEAAFDLREKNPTQVIDWIPTGSRWLDSIICKGKMAGIPVGKITELAGQSSVGKSYMAVQIAANAQKKDIFE